MAKIIDICFEHSDFENSNIVSNFVLRASDFNLLPVTEMLKNYMLAALDNLVSAPLLQSTLLLSSKKIFENQAVNTRAGYKVNRILIFWLHP